MILSVLVSLAMILAFRDRLFTDDRGLLGLAGYLMVVINFSYTVSQTPLIALNNADQHIQYKGLGVFLDRNPAGEIALAPVSGSPAEKAGILTGDVLFKVNDTTVEASASLDAVNTLKPFPRLLWRCY
ncbi:MAG TPA: PDZ domain-containing protein [Anaerolineaceae bacterium]|nr:PDZ domain-containing protein [Anaerolineaceae bacterium]HPN50717.1 PDZ domain-containing protein [Anaerolineaceae bacterium]